MTETPDRTESIFSAAIALATAGERLAMLDRECVGDQALRGRVEALLRAHDRAGHLLDRPVPRNLEQTAGYIPGEQPGTIIAGRYKLLEVIGEGGMGSVYMAQQTEPVKRAVAVKVIKAGMDSKAVLARFEAERQALALMDHPNIARVLDAGTTESGRPFFVMELVKGVPITQFCDERKLTTCQRLELFMPVCQAIQHAHQKGIIHRDIKPNNVLVAMYDDRPVPKVIDFGVAKAVGQTLTDKTLMTGFGAVVGTPEYMSPEQANLNNLDIDTRSDVYSLGVLLYELLTGSTPVDRKSLGNAAILEILRIVRDVEATRPSAKLSAIDTLPSVAANRGTEPYKLSRMMKRELDWVVLKALEKERTRRYETATALARDVERYLKDELVEARPPSVGYRIRKFANHHRGEVLAVSFVFLVLLAGVIGTTLGMLRAFDAESRATDSSKEADENKTMAELRRNDAFAALGLAKTNETNAKAQTLSANTARHALLMEQAMTAWDNKDAGEAIRYLDKVAPEFQQTWEVRFLRNLSQRKFRPFILPADETLKWLGQSNDGRWLVQTTFDGDRPTFNLLDSRTGKISFKFFTSMTGYSFSHDGKWLVVAVNVKTKDQEVGRVKIYDLVTGSERLVFADIPGEVFEVDVSPDDTRIALACKGKVLLCDPGTGKVVQTLDKAGEINRVIFSPNDKRLATWNSELSSQGHDLKVWDLGTGKEKFSRKTGALYVALSADGKYLALSTQTVVELWDAETGDRRWTTEKIQAQYIAIDFSPDSKHLVCTGEDQASDKSPSPPKMFVLDTRTGQIQNSFIVNGPHGSGTGNSIYAGGSAYLPDGQHVVAPNGIWNINNVAREILVCEDRSPETAEGNGALDEYGPMTIVIFRGDGKRLIACAGTLSGKLGHVQELLNWNAESGQQFLPVARRKGYRIDSRVFSWDGKRIAFGCHDGLLRVCDTETAKELVSIEGPKGQGFQFVAISPDGSWIATSDGKRIHIWDVASGAKKLTCEEQPSPIGIMAISTDGKRIAASNNLFNGKEQQILIWDAETGKLLHACDV